MEERTVALVWYIGDVSPSINSTFVEGLIEYARGIGRISVARVYGDWSRPNSDTTAEELAEAGFEMMHVPTGQKERINLIMGTWLTDLVNRSPHIDRLLLISGDSGLRPVLEQVRGHNLRTTVICDARHTDEHLLILADEYVDFRDLTLTPRGEEENSTVAPSIDREESFLLLQEAVEYIEHSGGTPDPPTVKVRLKLMNECFDEKKLGFSSWNAYLAEAEAQKKVKTRFREGRVTISLSGQTAREQPGLLPTVVTAFLQALRDVSVKTITSEGKKAKLSDIRRQLKAKGIDYNAHGYSSLKKVADAAAKRGLVFVSLKGSEYLLDLTKRGSLYL